MKIISWDIGIKNLAYCIMECTDNNERPYIIHEWDVINIIEDDDLECHVENCNNKEIKYYCKYLNEIKYLCKAHKTYHNVLETKWKNIKESILVCNNELCKTCAKNAKWTCNSEHYCSIHKNNLIKKYDKQITLDTYTAAKVKSKSVDEIKLSLIHKLDQRISLLQVEHVCIENQPSFKNPRMKAIADTLYTWFLIRGVVDKDIKGIHFISPSNKLKINGKIDDINKQIAESTNKYKTTKKLSIEHTKDILKYNSDYTNLIEKSKKSDDLCDTFLQGMYFFNNKTKYT